jgi:hypothetical protein
VVLGTLFAISSCALLQTPTYLPVEGAGAAPLRGDTTLVWGSFLGSPCLADVPGAASALGPTGAPLGFHLLGTARVGGYRSHWQGVQRTGFDSARHLFVSRSGGEPAVLVVKLEARPALGGPLGENSSPLDSPAGDRVVGWIDPDPGLNHAGGMALVGSLLAVPMSGGGRSRVVFLDISDPESPRRLTTLDHDTVPVPSTPRDASAVGMVRLEDGRYLLVLGVRSSKILEFYRSRGTSLPGSALSFELLGLVQGLGVSGFQNLSLLTQCDGALFLLGTHNTAVPPPSKGRDHLHWYRLVAGPDALPRLQKGGERWLHCEFCNLAAGAGFFVTRERALLLYATEFWHRKSGDWVVVEEFGPGPRLRLLDP